MRLPARSPVRPRTPVRPVALRRPGASAMWAASLPERTVPGPGLSGSFNKKGTSPQRPMSSASPKVGSAIDVGRQGRPGRTGPPACTGPGSVCARGGPAGFRTAGASSARSLTDVTPVGPSQAGLWSLPARRPVRWPGTSSARKRRYARTRRRGASDGGGGRRRRVRAPHRNKAKAGRVPHRNKGGPYGSDGDPPCCRPRPRSAPSGSRRGAGRPPRRAPGCDVGRTRGGGRAGSGRPLAEGLEGPGSAPVLCRTCGQTSSFARRGRRWWRRPASGPCAGRC